MYTMNVHDYSLLLSYFSPKTSVATSSNEPYNTCCICHKRLHHLCHEHKKVDFISAEKTDKKRRIKYALCGALPLAILGICQMAYNYARFGSPLDFGIQYSLTINDFTHSEFHLNFMLL